METSILRKEVFPFLWMFALLILATLSADFLLHQFKLVWIGRYLGIPGTLIILLSFFYSLRKRRLMSAGNPKTLLSLHEFLAWLGSLLVLIHAGIHFFAILPWLALIAMIINVISGLTGKFLLDRARRYLTGKKAELQQRGMPAAAIEKELFWDAVTLDVMKQWRAVHFPITLAFGILAIAHIISILLFWNWQ